MLMEKRKYISPGPMTISRVKHERLRELVCCGNDIDWGPIRSPIYGIIYCQSKQRMRPCLRLIFMDETMIETYLSLRPHESQ